MREKVSNLLILVLYAKTITPLVGTKCKSHSSLVKWKWGNLRSDSITGILSSRSTKEFHKIRRILILNILAVSCFNKKFFLGQLESRTGQTEQGTRPSFVCLA